MFQPATLRDIARRLQWRRGLRAAIAVAGAMLICRALGKPFGWAALGGFEAVLVDNGGPYRSRLDTILTVLLGGAVAGVLGSLVGTLLYPFAPLRPGASLPYEMVAVLATAALCFAFTFARVLTQPLASTSVIILVLYFAGLGSSQHTLAGAFANAGYFVAGGFGAAAISLFLWPLDPFRPARHNVAEAYALLASVTARIGGLPTGDVASVDQLHPEHHDWKRQLRTLMESARTALGQTAARAPARTLRARNLTVLLETADMLFARAIRLTELAEFPGATGVHDTAQWLGRAEQAISHALENAPADAGASFAREGSHTVQFLRRRLIPFASASGLGRHLAAEERDAQQELQIAFEAVRATWSGTDASRHTQNVLPETAPASGMAEVLLERLRADWSFDSIMLRHALRMAAVGAIDVLLMRALHVSHGFWLAMTSIIVLQPNGSGTMRRGLQRVGGTIAGGILAAGLAAFIHSQTGILMVITLCAGLTLASFAVDYGVYCFFLTPTFVLLSLPHLRDWRYAGIRIVTTVLGAVVAVLAMRLLWPEREERELARLLHAGADADAVYLRAMLRLWKNPSPEHRRQFTQARRTCGLTSNAAEETLDRLLLEPSFSRRPGSETEHALAFTTYLRRLTQSVTTLAALGDAAKGDAMKSDAAKNDAAERIEALALRLEGLLAPSATLPAPTPGIPFLLEDVLHEDAADGDFAELQMQRMERQVAVLERAAAAMSAAMPATV